MHQEIINNLRLRIQTTLLPILKGRKCVLLDVPYYNNIGDILIWEGTRSFLKDNNIPCLIMASKETFNFPVLDKDVVILLQGGGNFGDIWIHHQIFREKVVNNYKNNKIIIMPQTIYFKDEMNMIADATELAKHPDLTIIGRDNVSYRLLEKFYYKNSILMLPDMAFCIRQGLIRTDHKTGRVLFFKRTDIEADVSMIGDRFVPTNAEVCEWPTMDPTYSTPIIWRILISLTYRLRVNEDIRWDKLMRPLYIKTGVNFINQFDEVFTSRLHGCILSLLLGKPITFFDNSYGKNSSFYDTWLREDLNIKFIRQ